HLHEQLVEGLLTLFISTDLRTATLAPEGIDLVEKDEAGGIYLRMPEEIEDARRAHTDEHRDEVGPAQREIRDLRHTGDRPREQRLAGAGWTDQQDATRHARTKLAEAARRFEEFDNLFQLVLGFVDTDHLGEGDLVGVASTGLGEMLCHGAHRIAQQVGPPEQ